MTDIKDYTPAFRSAQFHPTGEHLHRRQKKTEKNQDIERLISIS
jgi:hypothetical protein